MSAPCSPDCEIDLSGMVLHAPWCWTGQHDAVPTTEDYCAMGGHGYAGDDVMHQEAEGGGIEEVPVGRCYCGAHTYPAGGPS